MIRYLLLILIFKGILFGCSLCSVYSPKTHVSVSIEANDKLIKTAQVKWVFAKEFTKELLNLYDTNLDATFDEKEIEVIQDALLAYIEPKNYLTHLTYSTKIEEVSRTLDIKKYKFNFIDGILSFDYEFDLNYEIKHNHKLYIEVYDDASYFIMLIDENKQNFNIPYELKKEMDYNSVTYTINAPLLATSETKEEVKQSASEVRKKEKNLIEKSLEEENVQKEETLLGGFVKKVKYYLVEIEKGEDNWALVFLLAVSFVYGIIHAMGPGHGKALAFSYFSAQKSSYFQAFIISLATAFIHIVGALILVVISIFLLQSVLNSFLDDSIKYITQTSAVLIMLLSIYILYRKLKKKSCACSACCSSVENKPMFSTTGNVNFVQKSESKIHFNNERKKQDLIFVLTAGLIPCPGTVVLFVYAFILKTYFSVILASIAISLGMGLVIFASSFLGVSLNKVSAKSTKIINIVEVLAPVVMFALGLLLLLNADIF